MGALQSSCDVMSSRPVTGPRLPYIRSMGRVPQFPVAGEVEGWGVFLIFGDVLRTFRI